MADGGPGPSPEGASSSPAPAPHFYPFATSPDIIRSHEKDAFITSTLTSQAQSIARSLRGARYAHVHTDAIKRITELLYFSLTTLLGNRTLGEEYCDVVQLEDDTLQFPSIVRRAGYIVSSILLPWVLQRILPSFRQRLRLKLERSVAREQAKKAQKNGSVKLSARKKETENAFFTKLRIQSYILEHLDSITSLSPIFALSLTTFYFTGAYYHLSKRFWGLRYVFTKKIGESEQRIGYEVLGVLLVLQMAVQGVIHIRQTLAPAQESEDDVVSESKARKDENIPRSIQNPSSTPLLPASIPRYDLSEDPTAVSWIPTGQQRKCTLCIDEFKDPSVTTCGHVFCWTCIRDWVREKPECPLCRQEVLASKVLPLRG
ncbi:peroxisome biosynthesis protein (Peroxin-10), putative [Paecilomyces variotii No. 5]|uniref:RING-type E3 ubiquitin transferase n=1 Tax=Byssochlamys spectabilis (strain No. 5 / NBRC 109023) TaxID=1356009 RepID=V5FWE7_BYSSN|nr:peroxisome biosynthesis protein (Peroxin-10), putative [Paecilomyces variotii No. 5]